MSANKITFGLEKVHIAILDDSGATPVWGAPVAVPGAVNFSPEPQGEESTFYADNMVYHIYNNNDGYNADLQMALVPDAVLATLLGWEIDGNGMLVETTDGEQKEFALMFEVKGDKKNRRSVYYRCKASRPGKEHATKEGSVAPSTDTLSLRIMPIEVNEKNIVKGTMEFNDLNASVYNAFFSEVILPNATPSAVVKTDLAAVIALAGTLTEADYTVASWAALTTALTAANTVNTDAEATQAQVNKATADLQDAILALEPETEA